MLVVMKKGSTKEDLAGVIQKITQSGLNGHVSQGVERTVIGVVGQTYPELRDILEFLPGVEEVIPIPKVSSREFQHEDTKVKVGDVVIGGEESVIRAGPCAVETEKQVLDTARAVKAAGANILRGGAFKPSASPYQFSGLPLITKVLTPHEVELVAKYADILHRFDGTINLQSLQLNKTQDEDLFALISSLIDQNSELQLKLQELNSQEKIRAKIIEDAHKEAREIRLRAEKEAQDRAAITIREADTKAKLEAERIIGEARQKVEDIVKDKIHSAIYQGSEIIDKSQEQYQLVVEDDKRKAEAISNGAVTQEQAAPIPGKEAASNDEVPMLCHGNVNLLVISPSGTGPLHKFSKDLGHLKRTHQIRVSKINVLSSQSIYFELFLQRPIPLLNILEALPEVATVSDGLKNSPESYRARQIRSQANTRLVKVKLKA
jgi:vacuolar-type H+-ATPase subunit H